MAAPPAAHAAECWQLRVRGRVQGVGYREACVAQAMALGVTGWVRNRLDGSVEVLLQGGPEALARMQAWLRQGPPAAQVDQLTVLRLPVPFPQLESFERHPTA